MCDLQISILMHSFGHRNSEIGVKQLATPMKVLIFTLSVVKVILSVKYYLRNLTALSTW